MRIVNAEFMGSYTGGKKEKIPLKPQLCIIGRSNVGKSSFINAILLRKIARTSSTPGATRFINLYQVGYEFEGKRDAFVLCDFPGFGYSKVSRSTYHKWEEMVESYFKKNDSIKGIVWLIDVRRDFDEMDDSVLRWIWEKKLPYSIVLTKIDKIGKNKAKARKASIEKEVAGLPIFLFSAKDGYGKQEITSQLISQVERS